MIWKFNEFPTTFEERMLQISDETYGRGHRLLSSPMRMIVDHNDDEEQQLIDNKEGEDSMVEEGCGDEEQKKYEKGDFTAEG